MGIEYSYIEKQTQDLYGTQMIDGDQDFTSPKALKNHIKTVFNKFQCPSCGGHQLAGSGVMIEFGKVRFFREDRKKGWFGTTKYVNTHAQDRWRIYSIYLKPSGTLGFLSPAGQIRCKTCTWKIKGGSSVRWVSLGDVMKGKF